MREATKSWLRLFCAFLFCLAMLVLGIISSGQP